MRGKIISVNLSSRKHVAKEPTAEVELRVGHGMVGDAHAGPGDRQVSLLAVESIQRQKRFFLANVAEGKVPSCPRAGELLVPGAFAENITMSGLDLPQLPLGTRLKAGKDAILEISKIGKECHRHCEVFRRLGDCVMPREGVFARVIRGGSVHPNDEVQVEEHCHLDGQ